MSFNLTSRVRVSRALLHSPSSCRIPSISAAKSHFLQSRHNSQSSATEADIPTPPPKRRGRPPKNPDQPPRIRQKSGPKPRLDVAEPEDKTILPPPLHWRGVFSGNPLNDRVSIANPKSAMLVAQEFVPGQELGKVIIEAFPGPGQLTRALLNLPKERISKLIVLESDKKYLEYLQPLEAQDPRLKVLPLTAAEWTTFDHIEETGLLADIETIPWGKVHPKLQYISHLPIHVSGEQLIAQFLRLIPSQSWLFKYGRVPMNFLLSEYVWHRLTAPPDDNQMRCKLSVIADATTKCSMLLFDELQPYRDHFHPIPLRKLDGVSPGFKTGNRRAGVPFVATSIVPLRTQAISPQWSDIWDYCLRRLYVQKATPLNKCINSLGPGALSLLPQIETHVNCDLRIRELNVRQWAEIVRAFAEWPFAPTDLGITDAMLDNYGGRGKGQRF